MRVLIAYATVEHHTGKIAKTIAGQIEEHGHDAVLFDTAQSPRQVNLEGIDKVVLAGSVHNQRHSDSLNIFLTAFGPALKSKPALFLSVSLNAAQPGKEAQAQAYIDEFLAETGWKPCQTLAVAGAIKQDEYDYFKSQILEHIVLKEPGNGALATDDHDFTDWSNLLETTRKFLFN